ncbi:MAG: TolC family protein [Planctomycetota bacterium]
MRTARSARIVRPEVEVEPAPSPAAAPDPAVADPSGPMAVDLHGALALAVRHNRDYLSRHEALYRQGLSYSFTRFQFGPLFQSTIAHVWADQENALGVQRLSGNLGVSQILPTGGRLGADVLLGRDWFERTAGGGAFGDGQYDSALALTLRQPLLRGAGYEVSHAALTQAERDLVYAIRDFELFRENFSIGIARSFFDLVSQQQTLDNEETNLRQAVFDRRQAEALLQVDRVTEVEVYRARRREIEAENRLLDARATFERARDQFKIDMGLPIAAAIEIAPAEPPFEPVRFDPDSAVASARANRLDLITEQQRLEDAEREVRIAENAVLPQLDLDVGVGLGADPAGGFGAALPDEWNASIGITMALPLQRVGERNNLRSAQIALEQARRGYGLLLDQIELEIKNQLRNLRSLEQQIALQRGQIVQEQRAVTVTEIRFESGDLDNRDLLEARNALFAAQNALIQLQVQHFIARLQLLRDLGLLFVDDDGMWDDGAGR